MSNLGADDCHIAAISVGQLILKMEIELITLPLPPLPQGSGSNGLRDPRVCTPQGNHQRELHVSVCLSVSQTLTISLPVSGVVICCKFSIVTVAIQQYN